MPVATWLHRIVTRSTPSRPAAVARVVVGVAALAKALDVALVAPLILGPTGLRIPHWDWFPQLPLSAVVMLTAVWAGAALSFALGWKTRAAGALLTASMAVILLSDQQLYGNHFYLLVVLSLLLTIADSGAALSMDARRGGGRDFIEGWPVTLIKLQLSIVYGYAVIAKLNAHYVSGVVLSSYWVNDGLFALPVSLRRGEVMFPLAVITLIIEAFLAVGLWLPRLRHRVFVLGLGLHTVIIATLGQPLQLAIFALLMFSVYLLFIDAAPHKRLVVWDEQCLFCSKMAGWFRRLDWLGVHRFGGAGDRQLVPSAAGSEEDTAEELHLVRSEGSSPTPSRVSTGHASGFAAITRILEALPISFLWAPILRVPVVARVGEALYRWAAARH